MGGRKSIVVPIWRIGLTGAVQTPSKLRITNISQTYSQIESNQLLMIYKICLSIHTCNMTLYILLNYVIAPADML